MDQFIDEEGCLLLSLFRKSVSAAVTPGFLLLNSSNLKPFPLFHQHAA